MKIKIVLIITLDTFTIVITCPEKVVLVIEMSAIKVAELDIFTIIIISLIKLLLN